MDQLRPIIAALKKHHFWMVTVAALGVLVYFWFTNIPELKEQYQTNKKKRDGHFEEIVKVKQNARFNEKYEQNFKEATESVSNEIAAARREITRRQRAARHWPTGMSEEFQKKAEKDGRNDKWPEELISEFWQQAPQEIDVLVKKLEVAENPDTGGLVWRKNRIEDLKTQFTKREGDKLSVEDMFGGLELLWIHETLLNSVAAVNEGSKDKFNLPIRAIDELTVGPAAERAIGSRKVKLYKKDGSSIVAPSPPAAKPNIEGVRVEGFVAQFRMDLSRTADLLTVLANQPLTVEIKSVYIQNPSRLKAKTAAPPKKKPAPVGGRFGGGKTPNKKEEKVEPQEEVVPASRRGPLVEIQGYFYVATSDEVDLRVAEAATENEKR